MSISASGRRSRAFLRALQSLLPVSLASLAPGIACGEADELPRFEPIRTQFIAALGDPAASSGTGAEAWGLWRIDPGPRGVRLDRYADLASTGGITPARWRFDPEDWWLEEHGLIMEKPDFPLPPGRYLVTGDREVTTMLTIHPPDDERENGAGPNGEDAARAGDSATGGGRRWELAGGATLQDVTHLPCRAARYVPASDAETCSPANARPAEFPVTPGAKMPPVPGCRKQDYAVLFVIGVAARDD